MATTYTLHTNNLSCASCAAKIEDDLKASDSIMDARVNVINHTATIIADVGVALITVLNSIKIFRGD